MVNYRFKIRIQGVYDPSIDPENDNPGEFKSWGYAYPSDVERGNWHKIMFYGKTGKLRPLNSVENIVAYRHKHSSKWNEVQE